LLLRGELLPLRHLSAFTQFTDCRKVKKRASWGSFSRSRSRDRFAQDGQEQSFIGAGQSRSEDGSPRTTLDDGDEAEEGAAGQCLTAKQQLLGRTERIQFVMPDSKHSISERMLWHSWCCCCAMFQSCWFGSSRITHPAKERVSSKVPGSRGCLMSGL